MTADFNSDCLQNCASKHRWNKFPFSDVLKFSQTYQVNSCKIGLIQNIGAVSNDDTDFISFLLYFLGHGPTPLDYYRTPTT